MIERKNILILIFGRCRPLQILGGNFRSNIETLGFVLRYGLAKKSVTFAIAVRPCGVEEVAAQVHRQLQGFEGLPVLGAAPTAHAPQPMRNVADFPSSAAKPTVFHDRSFCFSLQRSERASSNRITVLCKTISNSE